MEDELTTTTGAIPRDDRRPSKRIEAQIAPVFVVPMTKSKIQVVRRAVRLVVEAEGESIHRRNLVDMLNRPIEARTR
jgi:hypothetical protein